jgi:hypothetical protein
MWPLPPPKTPAAAWQFAFSNPLFKLESITASQRRRAHTLKAALVPPPLAAPHAASGPASTGRPAGRPQAIYFFLASLGPSAWAFQPPVSPPVPPHRAFAAVFSLPRALPAQASPAALPRARPDSQARAPPAPPLQSFCGTRARTVAISTGPAQPPAPSAPGRSGAPPLTRGRRALPAASFASPRPKHAPASAYLRPPRGSPARPLPAAQGRDPPNQA